MQTRDFNERANRPVFLRAIKRLMMTYGYYAGEIDGEWGADAAEAWRGFVHAVSNCAPTAVPDLDGQPDAAVRALFQCWFDREMVEELKKGNEPCT